MEGERKYDLDLLRDAAENLSISVPHDGEKYHDAISKFTSESGEILDSLSLDGALHDKDDFVSKVDDLQSLLKGLNELQMVVQCDNLKQAVQKKDDEIIAECIDKLKEGVPTLSNHLSKAMIIGSSDNAAASAQNEADTTAQGSDGHLSAELAALKEINNARERDYSKKVTAEEAEKIKEEETEFLKRMPPLDFSEHEHVSTLENASTITQAAENAAETVSAETEAAVIDTADTSENTVSEIGNQAKNVKAEGQEILGEIKKMGSETDETVSQAAQEAGTDIQNAVNGAAEAADNNEDKLQRTAQQAIEGISGAEDKAVDTAEQKINKYADSVISATGKAADSAVGAAQNAVNGAADVVSKTADTAQNIAVAADSAAGQVISTAEVSVEGSANSVVVAASKTADTVQNIADNGVSAAGQALRSAEGSAVGAANADAGQSEEPHHDEITHENVHTYTEHQIFKTLLGLIIAKDGKRALGFSTLIEHHEFGAVVKSSLDTILEHLKASDFEAAKAQAELVLLAVDSNKLIDKATTKIDL